MDLAFYDLIDRTSEKVGVLGFGREFPQTCRANPDGLHVFKENQSAYRCACGLERPKNGVKIVKTPPVSPLEGYPEFGQGRSKMNPRSRRSRLQILLERDGNQCYYCEITFDKDTPPTIDHVRPRSKGGTNHPANLVLACGPCNNDKGNEWDE